MKTWVIFWDFYEFNLYYIGYISISKFLKKIAIIGMDNFREIAKIISSYDFVKTGIRPSYHFL